MPRPSGGYAGVNEWTTVAMLLLFLRLRSTAEACIGSPNNLATLEATPASKVSLATSLTGLLRSIAHTMGTALAAVVWDVRSHHRLQQYAEAPPWTRLAIRPRCRASSRRESAQERSRRTFRPRPWP
jgi:hypothetical protein